jgi:hypothetical protein
LCIFNDLGLPICLPDRCFRLSSQTWRLYPMHAFFCCVFFCIVYFLYPGESLSRMLAQQAADLTLLFVHPQRRLASHSRRSRCSSATRTTGTSPTRMQTARSRTTTMIIYVSRSMYRQSSARSLTFRQPTASTVSGTATPTGTHTPTGASASTASALPAGGLGWFARKKTEASKKGVKYSALEAGDGR